jgi:hypothetical protein
MFAPTIGRQKYELTKGEGEVVYFLNPSWPYIVPRIKTTKTLFGTVSKIGGNGKQPLHTLGMSERADDAIKSYTANEGLMRIQYKCLVPIYEFPEMKLRGHVIAKTEI